MLALQLGANVLAANATFLDHLNNHCIVSFGLKSTVHMASKLDPNYKAGECIDYIEDYTLPDGVDGRLVLGYAKLTMCCCEIHAREAQIENELYGK